jgi:UDP-glucose 4-epimerase
VKDIVLGGDGFCNPIHLANIEAPIKELPRIIKNIADKEQCKIEYLSKKKGEIERNFAGINLAQEILSLNPFIGFEEVLLKTWGWFEQQQ